MIVTIISIALALAFMVAILSAMGNSGARHSTDLRSSVDGSVVVLDLETTGLNPNKNSILEIAARRVHFDKGVMSMGESFSTIVLLDEGKRVSSQIKGITGIDTKMMREQGIPRKEAIAKLIEFVGDDDIVGYNIAFDMKFLKAQTNTFDKKSTLCILQAARLNLKGLDSYKLVDVARHLKINNTGAHRALVDVDMTAKVMERIL